MSFDGSVVAIGAIGNDGSGGTDCGHVRVYQLNGDTWEKIGDDIDGEAANDESGHSVAISSDGTVVAIGAIDNDGSSTNTNSGHVRVYQRDESNTTVNPKGWTKYGNDIDGDVADNQLGSSVAMSSDGSVIAMGAIGNDESKGYVRVYEEPSTGTIDF